MHNKTDVEYWAKTLQTNCDQIQPLCAKMHDKVDSLSYQELFELRELLVQNSSLVRLLNEELAQPAPKSRWKKLFRK